eukprot:1315046-Prymnesium_polylepis.1
MVLGIGSICTGLVTDNQDEPTDRVFIPNTVYQVDEKIHHTHNKEDAKCSDPVAWAEHYCKSIWDKAKEDGFPNKGRFHILCTSMGGVLGHQVALAAERMGAPLDLIIMIDPIPVLPWAEVKPELLGMENASNWITGFFLGGKQDVSGMPEDDIPDYIAEKNGNPDMWGVKCNDAMRCVWQYFNYLDKINKGGEEMQKPCKQKIIFLNARDRTFMPMLFKVSEEEAKNEKNVKGMGSNVVDMKDMDGNHPAVGGSFTFAGKSTYEYRTETLPALIAKFETK